MSTIEQIKSEIRSLAEQEVSFVQRKRAADVTAAAVETAAGAALASGADNFDAAVEQAARAQTENRMLGAAISAVRQKRDGAVQRLRAAQRAEREEKLEEVTREAAELNAKVDRHRAAIEELLEVPIAIQLAGSSFSALQRFNFNRQGIQNQIGSFGGPVAADGTIDLQDTTAGPAEVAVEVLSTDRLAPSAEAIFVWFAACEGNAGQAFGDHQRRVYFTWRGGVIDEDASYIFVDDFMMLSGEESSFSGKQFLSTESATFRSNQPPKRLVGAAAESPAPPEPDPAVRRVSVGQLLGLEARNVYPFTQPENPAGE